MTARDILEVKGLTRRFGGVVAVASLDAGVPEGSITSIIGPNGAGKTTLFNCITGIYRPSEGGISFDGANIVGISPHTVVERGIARTFQNIRLFHSLTVLENVLIGSHHRLDSGVVASALKTRAQRAEEHDAEVEATRILDELGMADDRDAHASSLAYGRQRRLEIARALAAHPRLLLLDEPAAGLNPSEKTELKDLVRSIRAKGITVVLIEHDMKVVMDISDKVIVLDYGRKIAEGVPADVRVNPAVVEAYLGRSGDATDADPGKRDRS